jgi:hypothetical protein
VRSDLGKQAAKARQRGGEPGRRLEDRNRQQIYEVARERNVAVAMVEAGSSGE